MTTYQTQLTLNKSQQIVISNLPFKEGTKLTIKIEAIEEESPESSSDFETLLEFRISAKNPRRMVMNRLLDSCILIDHFRGFPQATDYLKKYKDNSYISVITRAEVLIGFEEEAKQVLSYFQL